MRTVLCQLCPCCLSHLSCCHLWQLGCGRSAAPEPGETTEYSIPASVRDLADVIKALGLRKYHLLGQSWGGILGYEFLRSGCSEAAGW